MQVLYEESTLGCQSTKASRLMLQGGPATQICNPPIISIFPLRWVCSVFTLYSDMKGNLIVDRFEVLRLT